MVRGWLPKKGTRVIKVLHIISNLEPGGAETMLAKLIGKMDRSRFEQCVVCLGGRGSMAEGLENDGAVVHALNLGGNLLGGIWRLRCIAEELSPDWIQGWMVHGNLFARLIHGVAPGAKLAWNIRHTLDLADERFRTRALIRISVWFAKRVDAMVSNSVSGAEDHERIGYPKELRRVIPNGFDLDRFRPNSEARQRWRHERGIPNEAILIGNAARFHPMKHQSQLIRAAAELPETHVAIAGRGIAGNQQLLDLAAELGVADRVHLLDHQLAIEDFDSALDVYCLCSKASEGFPTSVAEAMACGVPAAVTDVGDAALIVGETGAVAPPRDLGALVAALREVIGRVQTGREVLGAACRARIREKFELAKVIAEYESLYASAGGTN